MVSPIVALYIGFHKLRQELAPSTWRKVDRDVGILDLAEEEVWLSGINALGPLHQGREKLVTLLEKGGSVRVLMLDPDSEEFRERCAFENDASGRLSAEYGAAIAICRDIASTTPGHNALEVRLIEKPLSKSMVLVDPGVVGGRVNVNMYPKKRGTRGLTGPQRTYVFEGDAVEGGDTSRFLEFREEFRSAWSKGKTVLDDSTAT